MISGDLTLRTLNASSFAQQAVTFLCLDFSGQSSRFNELPKTRCPSGIRSQINFPSCWDGVNTDSPDHKSHVAFLSTGPDNGTCSDPMFPVTIPRIFMEVYWVTQAFDDFRRQAAVPDQPFVFSNGDPTGYSYHADFMNGWDEGVLEQALDGCNCNPYGDPSCCAAKGLFDIDQTRQCYITNTVDEITLGTLDSLPGSNPVQADCYEQFSASYTPALLSPAFIYSTAGQTLSSTATISVAAQTVTIPQKAQGTCISNEASYLSFRLSTYIFATIWAICVLHLTTYI
uniref:DUF1996 domain-containing protein n=1 Tax=Psilocybe cubensis TaxID=181762 RepID=A0A8H8CIG2_PSICU